LVWIGLGSDRGGLSGSGELAGVGDDRGLSRSEFGFGRELIELMVKRASREHVGSGSGCGGGLGEECGD